MPILSPQTTPYYGGGQVSNPANVIQTSGQPTSSNINQSLGTLAVDNSSGAIWALASKVGGLADWVQLGSSGGYPISPYVVGPIGQAGYQTIQSALDAAHADGGGLVYVQPGTYTENLTLYDACPIQGTVDYTTIVGIHIPPESGTFTFDSLILESSTHIFSSTAAGTASLNINNSFIIITNGYVFNLLNWAGELLMDNCGEASTQDGVVNNTGGAIIKFINVEMGAGSSNTMTLTGNGNVRFDTCNINCPINIAGSGTFIFQNGVSIKNILTIGGSKSGSIIDTVFLTGATQPLVYNSSNPCNLSEVTFDSSAATVISGTGTINYGEIVFRNASTVSGVTLTATGSVCTGPNIITGTLTVGGNVVFGITGNKIISSSVATTTAAGANSFGSVTLVGGTATINTTSVTSSSLIYIWRQSIGATGAAAVGSLTVGTIVNATSFVINSIQNSNATALQTTDVSVVGWVIVN